MICNNSGHLTEDGKQSINEIDTSIKTLLLQGKNKAEVRMIGSAILNYVANLVSMDTLNK